MKKLLLVATLMAGAAQATAAEKLYLFNWNDYIAEDTVKRFEQQCGCELVQEFYSGTEEMMAKLAAGASGYDVIIPTQNAVEALIRKGDLLELDKSRLANLSNEAAGYLDKDFDKGNRYSLPYAFTTTLVGYNKTELDKLGIDPADWSVIFDPAVLEKIKGRVTVMDGPAGTVRRRPEVPRSLRQRHRPAALEGSPGADPRGQAVLGRVQLVELYQGADPGQHLGRPWLLQRHVPGQGRRGGCRPRLQGRLRPAPPRCGAGHRQHGDPQGLEEP